MCKNLGRVMWSKIDGGASGSEDRLPADMTLAGGDFAVGG